MFNQEMCLDLLSNSLNQHRKKSVLNSKEKTDVVTATAPACFFALQFSCFVLSIQCKTFKGFFRANLLAMRESVLSFIAEVWSGGK